MTKRILEAFARKIAACPSRTSRALMIELVSDIAQQFNPRFDEARFVDAIDKRVAELDAKADALVADLLAMDA